MLDLSSPTFMCLFILTFIVIQVTLHVLSIRAKSAQRIAAAINVGYGIASGVFFAISVYTLYSANHWTNINSLWCSVVPPQLEKLTYIYYVSKMWEAVDIILVALMGYPINLHFRVHHNTTVIMAWMILKYQPASGITFMLLNTLMHFILYLYLGGVKSDILFVLIRVVGHVQLLCGMFCSALALHWYYYSSDATDGGMSFRCTRGPESELVQLALCAVYFVLLRMEINDEEKAKLKKERSD